MGAVGGVGGRPFLPPYPHLVSLRTFEVEDLLEVARTAPAWGAERRGGGGLERTPAEPPMVDAFTSCGWRGPP